MIDKSKIEIKYYVSNNDNPEFHIYVEDIQLGEIEWSKDGWTFNVIRENGFIIFRTMDEAVEHILKDTIEHNQKFIETLNNILNCKEVK